MATYRVAAKAGETLSPDCAGDYPEAGTYNGQPYYRRGTDELYLWYRSNKGTPEWDITTVLGSVVGVYRWFKSGSLDIPGDYQPYTSLPAASGTATVALVPPAPAPVKYQVLSVTVGPGAGMYITLQEIV